jgi:hypothetical protein
MTLSDMHRSGWGVFLLVTSVGPVQRWEHGGTSAPQLAEEAAGSVGLIVGLGPRDPFSAHSQGGAQVGAHTRSWEAR